MDLNVAANPATESLHPKVLPEPRRSRVYENHEPVISVPTGQVSVAIDKLERLHQLRDSFQALAGSGSTNALRIAKQLTNDVERETALLTLVTEWTHGELSSPQERAHRIDVYGFEAGLGMELAKNPNLALVWANELPEGPGRTALLAQTAIGILDLDPVAAFAFSDQLPPKERNRFNEAVFAGWAEKDTESAIQWADQLTDPGEREAATQAIRGVAPVGIGTALSIKDGYPVVNQLLPGTPAELSGQIHPGDRIVALAQGDSAFVDLNSLSLADIVQRIRGLPGTVLQLQIQSADAPASSPPQTISIVRDQIKFKK